MAEAAATAATDLTAHLGGTDMQSVKRPERRVDLTVAPEQQPCCVQVVAGVSLSLAVNCLAFLAAVWV